MDHLQYVLKLFKTCHAVWHVVCVVGLPKHMQFIDQLLDQNRAIMKDKTAGTKFVVVTAGQLYASAKLQTKANATA